MSLTVVPSRREQRKQELFERIIDAGRVLFGEQGIEATTIDQLCQRAGVSRMTFYAYFPTKLHLTDALFYEELYRPLDELIASVRAQSDSTITRLRLFFEGSARKMGSLSVEQHALIKELTQTVSRGQERAARDWAYLRTELKLLLEEGRRRGDITDSFSPEILLEVVAGSCDSIAISWCFDRSYPADLRFIELADFVTVTLRKS